MSEKEQLNQVEAVARARLKERGVETDDIAELVYFLQKKYHPDLTMEVCSSMWTVSSQNARCKTPF